MRNSLYLGIVVLLLLSIGCTKEESGTTVLVTEEVLYASGEQVRILGRLITNQAVTATDHGFYLSQEANFASPIIISLGAKSGAGRFIGETSGLQAQKNYFVKSFMDIGNGIEFGNTIELQTLAAGIESYSPYFGSPNQEIFILGRNFSSDTKVFFGDVEAEVLENLFESRLRVRIPELQGGSSVAIRVQSQDQILTFPINFEYQTGSYVTLQPFPDQLRLANNISFQSGSHFYVGLGSNRQIRFYEKILKYDPSTNQWTDSNFSGSARSFGFATDNYLGGGIAELTKEPYVMNNSFWRITSTGYVRLKDLTFPSRESIAFELANELYLLGGKDGNTRAVRKYNALTESWTNLPNSLREFSAINPYFVYQNKLYVLGSDKVLYSFDPISGRLESISSYPGLTGLGYGFAKVIGSKVYFGGFELENQVWEFNLETFNWVPKNPIPGSLLSKTAASFVQGGFIYFMRQEDINLPGDFPLELFIFDPTGI
jgi:hypothetical protein